MKIFNFKTKTYEPELVEPKVVFGTKVKILDGFFKDKTGVVYDMRVTGDVYSTSIFNNARKELEILIDGTQKFKWFDSRMVEILND